MSTDNRPNLVGMMELVMFLIESLAYGISFLTTETIVKMNKTAKIVAHDENGNEETFVCDNPFYGRVHKHARVKAVLRCNYAEKMQAIYNELGLGEFTVQPRTWGEKVNGSAVVEHKGNYYLDTQILESLGSTLLLDNDKEIKREDYPEFFKEYKNENPIIIRDYKIESIRELTIVPLAKKFEVS